MWTLDSLALLIHKVASSAATKVSDLVNDLGFVDTAGAAAAAPVQSVASKTGAVELNTSDLNNDLGFVDVAGAAAAAPVQSVNGNTGAVTVAVPVNVSDLNNDSGFVDAAGAAAAAPVQSVNSMTGTVVVNPITTWTPSSTATALQVIAHAQANPGLIFCWARYQAATYTPVNTSAAWTYTLYTNYSTDANYVIFEAENNTNGRLFRCDAFGDWHELVRAEDVRYKAGDTFTVANVSAAIPGYVTTSGKAIHLSVPVDKSLANISSVSVTTLKGYIRHAGGGYVDASGATVIDWKGSSYTVAADKASPNLVHISITKTTALTNVTNNTPVAYQPSALTLSFS